jgi:hypothetical protein
MLLRVQVSAGVWSLTITLAVQANGCRRCQRRSRSLDKVSSIATDILCSIVSIAFSAAASGFKPVSQGRDTCEQDGTAYSSGHRLANDMRVDVGRDVAGDNVMDMVEGRNSEARQAAIEGAAPEAPFRLRLKTPFHNARPPGGRSPSH